MRSTMMTTVFSTIFLLATSTPLAAGIPLLKRATPVQQLTAVLSNANACPASTGECVTPADALNPILDGFSRYQILTAPEQAAVLGLMAFESLDFQYNHNVSPGRPGQGTRAMFMPNYVAEYIASMPEMNAEAQAVANDPVKTLALVQDNEHSFAAASWFYAAKCSDAVKSQVKAGGRAGWAAYITTCVGTDANDERAAYWERACKQFGCPTA